MAVRRGLNAQSGEIFQQIFGCSRHMTLFPLVRRPFGAIDDAGDSAMMAPFINDERRGLMIETNIRIEPKSTAPSLSQAMINTYTTGLNSASLAWGMASPFRMMLMMRGINRSLVESFGKSLK